MKSTFGAVVLLTLLSGPALATAQDTPRMGGVLKAAMIGEPPSLDLHATSADGGRRYTFQLRRGVKFHNGKEMTSADVVASLTRWGKMASTGKALWKFIEAIEAKEPYDVVIHLKEPTAALLDRHLKLARFKDYAARAEPPNGFGGKRTAYVDEILFIPVPDVTVRLAGVETGEYHFAQQ